MKINGHSKSFLKTIGFLYYAQLQRRKGTCLKDEVSWNHKEFRFTLSAERK